MDTLGIVTAINKTKVVTETNAIGGIDEIVFSSDAQRFSSIADPASDPHVNGEYFKKHPTWHVEYSSWKAENIGRFLDRKNLRPGTVADVGCGAGQVLKHLQARLDTDCRFWGYDVAPEAIRIAKGLENDRLQFDLADFGEVQTPFFDLLLALEVVDHVENYLGFLRMLKSKANLKLFSFSLDISAQSALREGAFLQRREMHSHLHHFNKETVLSTLQYTGYEIVDYFYLKSLAFSSLAVMAKPVRNLLYAMAPDLTVRMLGGYSLIVLAR